MDTVSHSSSHAARCSGGFTLLELLVTLAVAAILVTIAIPSYRGLVQSNSMTAAINDLVGDLNYARSEAVTRGKPVFLCKSKDQTTCTKDGDWSQGWLVYVPDLGDSDDKASSGVLLRVHDTLGGDIRITGNNNIANKSSFDTSGFAGSKFGSFTVSTGATSTVKQIKVAMSGRVRVTTGADS